MAKKATTKTKKTVRKTKRTTAAEDTPDRDEAEKTTKKTVKKTAAKKTTKKAAAKKTATKKTATKKTAAKKTTAKKTVKKAAAKKKTTKKTAAKKTTAKKVEPVSSSAEVREDEGGIVIRFPSAAPPAAASEPAAEKETKPAARKTSRRKKSTKAEEPVEQEAVEAPREERVAREDRPQREDRDERDEREEREEGEGGRKRRRRRRRRGKGGNSDENRGNQVEEASPEDDDDNRGNRVEREDREERDEDDDRRERGGKRRRRRRGKGGDRDRREEPAEAREEKPRRDSNDDDEDDWREEVGSLAEADPEARDDDDEQDEDDRPKRKRGRRGRRGRGKDGPEEDDKPIEIKDRPAVTRKEMIINVAPREECRIGILEDGKLEEIYLERASASNHVGNIYKGVVTNVESSIQAAFIDFGLGKNGFLHVSDLHPQYFPAGERQSETIGRKMPRRNRPPIQQCLRRGQELLVQITKEGIGTKGPTLTTYLSVPGRYMVMLPGMRRVGVSRKIEDEEVRGKLREAMSELELPGDIGFIARTAASERTKKELQADLKYLQRLWQAVDKRIARTKAPAELYRESDLVTRTIRDVYSSDIDKIIVDDEEVAERAREFLSIFSPKARDSVETYTDGEPIFHKYGIEQELERLHTRHVPLPSGGSLVIDQTEALVAIDVNSGKFRTEADAETTAFKINVEAAEEIPRQLRLRDLGGVVVCDFIDMRMEKHKREIERRLNRNLKEHKERAKVLRTSQFGLIELTRQRQRASLTRSVYQDCEHCAGTGLVKTGESVSLDVMRRIQLAANQEHIRTIEVSVSSDVAYLLQNRKRALLADLEERTQRTIAIRGKNSFGLDRVDIQCTDSRGRVVPYTLG